MKGITLNYETSNVVNFTALRRMILEDNTPLLVHNRKKLKGKLGCVLMSEQEGKEYKVVFKKRRLMNNFYPILTFTCKLLIYYLFIIYS